MNAQTVPRWLPLGVRHDYSDELPEPQDLAAEVFTELEAVVDDLRNIVAALDKEVPPGKCLINANSSLRIHP